MYSDLISQIVARLTTFQPTPVIDDIVFDVVQSHTSTATAIPMSRVMLQSAKACWDKPVLVPISNKKLDHMYRAQEESAEFLFRHLQPNSVVVSSSSKSRRHYSTSSDREGKKLDSYGHRLYSTGALGIKSHNYIAFVSCFVHSVFEDLAPILQKVRMNLKRKPCNSALTVWQLPNKTSPRLTTPWKHQPKLLPWQLLCGDTLGSGPLL